MAGGSCQDISDNPNGSFAGSLVLFQDNLDTHARSNVAALLSAHHVVNYQDDLMLYFPQ